MLLDPLLVPYFEDAWVLNKEKLFDAHDPICLKLRCPHTVPCVRRWNLPHAWSQHEPNATILRDKFSSAVPGLHRTIQACDSPESLTDAFRQWASQVEDAVHLTLKSQHEMNPLQNPTSGLPKRARGRCCPRKLIQRPVVQCSRPARKADFAPDCDATTVLTRLKVRQVRRVESLLRALRSRAVRCIYNTRDPQLWAEWRAIQRARGYPPNFPAWVLQTAHFVAFPDFPTVSWLEDLHALLRVDCNGLVQQEAQLRKNNFKFAVQLDSQFASARQGYAAVRGPSHPPFTEVPARRECHITHCLQQGPEQAWFTLQQPTCFFVHAQAEFNDCSCRVVEVDLDRVLLQGSNLPTEGRLVQHHTACTPEDLSAEFCHFWEPMWQRDPDPQEQSAEDWTAVDALLEHAPLLPVVPLELDSVPVWRATIQRMSDRRATGICGWRPAELKLLPDSAIQLLANLFSKALSLGIPASLLVARISVLAKVPVPESIAQSRPIVAFSTIYRIWSSVVSRQILKHWGQIFPPAVMGSMPRRSARDLSYRQQHLVERAILDNKDLLGLSLDIIKCFNCIPWQPALKMMKRLGIPSVLVDCWGIALGQMCKRPVFMQCVGPAMLATTGVPEGDPLSVVAMAAICFHAAYLPEATKVAFRTYVANWTWTAESVLQLQSATPALLDFLANLRLEVDWRKTYTWSATKRGRTWLAGPGQDLFPTSHTISVTSSRCELGTPFQFSCTVDLSTRNGRLQEGLERLRRLAKQPRPLLERATTVQSSVFPAAFYGAEGHCHSCSEVAAIRSAAAYAIIGEHKTMSPWLALGAVTDKVQDPQLYLLEQQLQMLRRALWLDLETGLGVLEDINRGRSRSAFGPAGALRLSLPQANLKLDVHGTLTGPDLVSLDLCTCNKFQIRRLLQMAWAIKVAQEVSHRNGLHAELLPDPRATGRLLKQLSPPEALTLARHIAGGFQSGAAKSKWDPEASELRQLCGALDTKEHRILRCPCTQQV